MADFPLHSKCSALSSKGFIALFGVQFLGAFNDNLFKNAMIILIAFQLSQTHEQTGLYITLAAGLFILPFFLFSSLAGQIADHYPKTQLIRKIKLAEILIMLGGAVALLNSSLELLYLTLFLMGAQSAFFGPIKYAILPEMLDEAHLLRGNGWFSGSTFIAILLGTIAGGLTVTTDNGIQWVAAGVVLVAVLGYLISFGVPMTLQQQATVRIDKNLWRSTRETVASSRTYPAALFAVLAISWFWFIGAVLLSQIPTLVKYNLQANEDVVVAFLTAFSVGIALGAGLAGWWFKHGVTLRWHTALLLLMSILLALSVWSADSIQQTLLSSPNLLTLPDYLLLWPQNLALLFMGLLAVVGGLYIVPLYTQLQQRTAAHARARMVAVNNILNALLMVLSSLAFMAGFMVGLDLPMMLLSVALLNAAVAVWFYKNKKV
ncbi:MAG: MFS transporter [Gammaproteobacteria bacterium]|nr:MFS transporter [Gammaproteobacteria bacterium]